MTVDYVIVGAGPAAVAAAETLRANDANGSILILSGEGQAPYSRMAIPYVLTGLINNEGTHLRKDDGHFDGLSIEVRAGKVVSIDTGAKTLSLEDGSNVAYGKLLIATGASPIAPPIEGLDLPGVHHCWTLDDCDEIAKLADDGADILLMGAGFIGCIILEALAARGANLTVVEAEDRMVPRMMDETAGNMIKTWCQQKGMDILTSTRVNGLSQRGERLNIALDNGETRDASLVVVATGVRANTSFVDGSGIEVDEGIKIDQFMQTNVADVYAAGDCAQGLDFSTNGWSVHAIQPTATEHGRIAALNMTGNRAEYKGSLNMNVLDTAGLISSSFGEWQGVEGGETAQVLEAERFRYTQLAFKGERLVGALTIGRTENIGVLRGLIQSRTNLGVWKQRLMKNPNRIMEAYIAGAHG